MTQRGDLERVRAVKSAHEADLMRDPNVVAVGIGRRGRTESAGGQPVIVVSIRSEEHGGARRSRHRIPPEIEGVPVEIRLVGDPRAMHMLASRARARHAAGLLRLRNVVGVGVGFKETAGSLTDQLSVIVSVEKKLPAAQLDAADLVPEVVDAVQTDVVETGRLVAFARGTRDRWRPVMPPGVSVAHYAVTAATFGCLVLRAGRPLILSNNHVLADTNRGRIGDAVFQPSPADGGTTEDRVAVLAGFVPIDFGVESSQCRIADLAAKLLNLAAAALGSSHRLRPVRQSRAANEVDAAIAEPLNEANVRNEILFIGAPIGIADASLGAQVQKTGRTSGYTRGVISQIEATVRVNYAGAQAMFTNQFLAGAMSKPGDSGSAVLDMDRRVVGLLFAGSQFTTVCNPIRSVLSALDASLAV